jgi:hypothetical protein
MKSFNPFAWLPTVLLALVVAGCSHLPAQPRGAVPNKDFPFSFDQAPFINPRIVQDLSTWISDSGDQVVAISLLEAQDSNRYYGAASVRKADGGNPFVYTETTTVDEGQTNQTSFGYQFVGVTRSGVHVLRTSAWLGGSGVFQNLLLVAFEYDSSLTTDWMKGEVHSGKRRFLIKKRGEIVLGDRWSGELKVNGNSLLVGKDQGWFTVSEGTGGGGLSYDRKDRVLKIVLDR